MNIVVLENSGTIFGNLITSDSAVYIDLQTNTVTILKQAGRHTSRWANLAANM